MTPAQAQAAIRRAQQQKQPIDKYNRAVREHNSAVTKAVDGRSQRNRQQILCVFGG